MMRFAFAFLFVSLLLGCALQVEAQCAALYGQCGGNGYTGPTCCASGSTCNVQSEWYSQCIPGSAASTKSTTKTAAATSTKPPSTSPSPPPPSSVGLQYRGADISSLLMLESKGISYKTTSGSSISFEKLLAQSGANMARQRIWVNPSDGNYNLAYNLKLAARSKAAGLQIYLDLHFSDTWADPAHQTTPAKWAGQDINTLAWTVYNYTRDVSNAFANAGITPAMISIGNEIGGGFLWPLGSYNSYSNTARLLHSAAWGVKDSKVGKQTQIMIHVEDGWNWSKQQFFYDTVLNQGTLVSSDFDIMGVSYYPFYNSAATLANLKSTLLQMSTRYGKKLMVVETNWPYSCPSPSTTFPSDVSSISFSDPGQSTWMRSVATTVRSVNGGIGVMYWEPGWIGNAGLGSSCYDNLLVDSSGKARNSMGVFASL